MSVLPARADCVIVGGGVVGCSLAYHLARAGVRPLLLDRGDIGAGSTARNAGGVRQQFSTEVNVRIGMLSRHLLEHFEEEVGATADFRPVGYMFVASSDEQMDQLRRNVEMQHRIGLHDVRLLTTDEVREHFPALNVSDVVGGTFCPSDGLAGPNEVTTGYIAAARRHGAQVFEGVAVESISHTANGVSGVFAGGAEVTAPMVINCAGPYAGVVGAMAGLDVPVKPFRRHIFITEKFDIQPPPPMTVDVATSFYLHTEGDGLLLGMSDPAEPSSFDTSVDWGFLEHLVEHATDRVPALAGAAIRTGWAGLYEVTPDNQAIVGESGLHGFWLCCGFSGHGFMQAPAIGRLLAAEITGAGSEVDLTPLRPDRFARGSLTPEEAVV